MAPQPSIPMPRKPLARCLFIPPSAIIPLPALRAISPSLTRPNAGDLGWLRVAKIGDTKTTSVPDRFAAISSTRLWAAREHSIGRLVRWAGLVKREAR